MQGGGARQKLNFASAPHPYQKYWYAEKLAGHGSTFHKFTINIHVRYSNTNIYKQHTSQSRTVNVSEHKQQKSISLRSNQNTLCNPVYHRK